MSKKKRKYFVNDKEASKLFLSFGFHFKRLNWYSYRVYHEEFAGFFDWFHTQGTVCVNKGGTYFGKLDKCGNAERLVKEINGFVYKNI